MPIKNCLKIFASKASMVWSIILYFVIVSVILIALSLFALVPVYELFEEYGVIEKGSEFIISFIINGYTGDLSYMFLELLELVKASLLRNPDMITVLTLYVFLVGGLLCRFLVGIIELPLVKKFQGAMSDNGNYSFSGIFISVFPKSMLFSLVKILIKFSADMGIYSLVYVLLMAMIDTNFYFFTPFIIIIILVVYYAFKYGACACWGAAIAIEGKRIFPALVYSVKKFFNSFGKLFGAYVIIWFLIFMVNYLVIRYTFGAGAIITIPASLLLINVFNVTYFYDLKKYRYYVSGEIVDPSEKKA